MEKNKTILAAFFVLLSVFAFSFLAGCAGSGENIQAQMSADANQTNGTLNVSSIPSGANIYVDGISKGVTPKILSLTAGSHTLLLTKTGYNNYQTPFTINAGQTTYISATLTPLQNQTNGTLSVYSNPSGASVSVDGTYRGLTPLTISIGSGNHALQLTKTGYVTSSGSALVSTGKITSVTFTLTSVSSSQNVLGYIAYWSGKVNQHQAVGASWGTDPDGKSGAGIPSLIYCKKWFPSTMSAQSIGQQYIYGWKAGGNTGNYNGYGTVYECRLNGTANQTQNGTLNVSSVPSGANIYVDGISKGITPKSLSLSAGSHTLLLTKTGYNNYQTPFSITAGQTTTISAVLTLSNGTNQTSNGSLYVTSVPSGAMIYLDNSPYAYSTTPQSIGLPAGPHTLKLTKTGYNDYITPFTIYAGQTTTINAILNSTNQSNTTAAPPSSTYGNALISSTPTGASVYIDNVYKGYTPKTVTSLSAGTHSLKLLKSGYQTYTSTLTITAGQTTTVSAELVQLQVGSLSVSSTPSAAYVYVDNILKGTTPRTVSSLSTGSHQLKVTKPGYNDYTAPFTINTGQTTTVSAVLTPSITPLTNQTNSTANQTQNTSS